jgi:predicted permease
MLYLVFFTPAFYTWGFWTAARYGAPAEPSGFGAAFNDELRLYPFLGMLAGVVLNLTGVARPAPLVWLNHVLIPLDTALYLTAIGSQLTFHSPRPWLHPCLVMSGIKFLYTPLVAWGLLELFRIEGLTRFIVLVQASNPVAVSPLVLPLLFGLDRRLANALWLFTTVAAVPWFALTLPLLQRL